MTIEQLITNNGIRQADAVIVKKEKFGLFDHYVIFLGYINNEPKFIANYGTGVRIIQNLELFQFLQTYKPVSVRRFKGSDEQRGYAIQRALTELKTGGFKAYHLIKNNCEHFANQVQHGIRVSSQTQDFSNATAISGMGLAVLGAATKSKPLILGGLALTILGAIGSAMAND
jgi:hypothetical protein